MKILITGAAGFIGYHLVKKLSTGGHEVIGIDNMCENYQIGLKQDRLHDLGVDVGNTISDHCVKSSKMEGFAFLLADIRDKVFIANLFKHHKFDVVVHLAALAGVRKSLCEPLRYIENNIEGFANIIDASRISGVKHFVYASSSSVYGCSNKLPFSETDYVSDQTSVYAVTKRADETIAEIYSKMYGIACSGMRFFSVYGPWGRPDMAPYKFAESIVSGSRIEVYNRGRNKRDFTYVDDVVECIFRIVGIHPKGAVWHEIYNVGTGCSKSTGELVELVELAFGKKTEIVYTGPKIGDIEATCADTDKILRVTGYKPCTDLKHGLYKFAEWFKNYKYGQYRNY